MQVYYTVVLMVASAADHECGAEAQSSRLRRGHIIRVSERNPGAAASEVTACQNGMRPAVRLGTVRAPVYHGIR